MNKLYRFLFLDDTNWIKNWRNVKFISNKFQKVSGIIYKILRFLFFPGFSGPNLGMHVILLCFDLWPGPQKMIFQGDAPEGSDTFQWPVIERDRMGGLRLIIWDKVKVPLCQYRLMARKRVISELHDSYFLLMTIKHSISKIQWAIM